MMLRHLAAGAAVLCLAGAAAAEAPGKKELGRTSWGKPGVSLEDYRIDAGICAWRAMNMDIADSEPARMMVKASQALENVTYQLRSFPNPGGQALVSEVASIDVPSVEQLYRVDKQLEAVSDLQYDALYACLESRGYRKFQLTEEQRRTLRKLKRGSLDRHRYLHRLASDPDVVSRQAL